MLSCQLTSASVNSNASTVEDVFSLYLNLKPSENDVRNSSLENISTETTLTTSIYIRYLGNEAFMDTLINHDSYLEASELNSKFRKIDCVSSQFPDDFSFWTDSSVDLLNKECYIGIYFPYIHYIIRNPTNDMVDHFITGIRG
jgi:hypothetical protein